MEAVTTAPELLRDLLQQLLVDEVCKQTSVLERHSELLEKIAGHKPKPLARGPSLNKSNVQVLQHIMKHSWCSQDEIKEACGSEHVSPRISELLRLAYVVSKGDPPRSHKNICHIYMATEEGIKAFNEYNSGEYRLKGRHDTI